jgi:hypothetical protein
MLVACQAPHPIFFAACSPHPMFRHHTRRPKSVAAFDVSALLTASDIHQGLFAALGAALFC